jgi:hypothetical protein
MNAKVHLQVKGGSEDGRVFTFAEHDTFVFGRMDDCHACIANDNQVSRHHFILETNPPHACLRDLGSLNGTCVNDTKFGGRKSGETPEQGAKRRYPEVELSHGDAIRVGKTTLHVVIETPKEPPKHKADPAFADLLSLSPKQLALLLFGDPKKPGRNAKLMIPGYQIEAEIGRGGFGVVYRARRPADNSLAAIKVMLARVDSDDTAIGRFQREIEIVSQLQHPHVVRLFKNGNSGAIFYLLTEYCDGGNAWDLMRKNGGRLTVAQTTPIILQTLSGLAYAHTAGIVHRDIKPQNILMHRGEARLSDFGLSKSFEQAGLSGLTMTGRHAGTSYFMPREQITNFKYMKPDSDVWSMGATIYNMLTGDFPYPFNKGRDPIDVILNDDIVPIGQRDKKIPKNMCAVLDKALNKKARDRFQTAAEMLAAMKKALP